MIGEIEAIVNACKVVLCETALEFTSAAAERQSTLDRQFGVRSLALARALLRYGERLVGHDAVLRVVAGLRVSLFDALRRGYPEITVHEVALEQDRMTFDAFNVRSTPYAVAIDGAGIVRGRGVVNSLEQIEELLDEARAA